MADQGVKTPLMCLVDLDVAPMLKVLKINESKKSMGIILRINPKMSKEGTLICEEQLDDVETEDIMEALPEDEPRYVAYSYQHKTKDDQVTLSHIFINYHPAGYEDNEETGCLFPRYAANKLKAQEVSGATKSLDLAVREDLTDEWLLKALNSE